MIQILDEGLPFGPTVDDNLVRRPTLGSLRLGIGSDKPLVTDTTDDEFTGAFTEQGKVLRWIPRSLLLDKLALRHLRVRSALPRRARCLCISGVAAEIVSPCSGLFHARTCSGS